MKVLMVLTSHDQLGNTGDKTGFWLEEFASPYYVFRDAGAEIILASPHGGRPPLDPKSDEPGYQTDATHRYKLDMDAQYALAHTWRLSTVNADDYDTVFYPGGHGPLWDLAENSYSIRLIERMNAAGKPVAAVCHAPAAFLHARAVTGAPLVYGKAVTGFANSEEAAVGLTTVVPFLLEDELKNKGGEYSKGADWQPYVVVHDNLVTGQNPASSAGTARAALKLLKESQAVPSIP